MKYVLLFWLGVALSSCLGPGAGDQTGYSSYVQDHGTVVVSLEADKPSAMKLAANAGITGTMVQLHTAFAGGALVHYWDFGTATTSAKPVWRFRRHVRGKPDQTVDHPDLIDSIPGDMSYSPLRAVYVVYVTPDYDGERITSLRALDDAIELGLLYEPKPLGKLTNCPVVPAATRLELGDGKAPLAPDVVYYHGLRTTQFCLDSVLGRAGLFTLPEKGPIMAPNAYALQRKGEPVALDEAAFAADLTGNGDQLDTNVVFAVSPTSPRYSSLWTQVQVIVPAGYVWADDRAESDLFVKQTWGLAAISGKVEQVTPSMTLWNRPIQGVVP